MFKIVLLFMISINLLYSKNVIDFDNISVINVDDSSSDNTILISNKDGNVSFVKNQKYVCVFIKGYVKKEEVYVMSQEEAFKYPTRFYVNDKDILITDKGLTGNFFKEGIYINNFNENIKWLLYIESNKKYLIVSDKIKENQVNLLHVCSPTNNWTLVSSLPEESPNQKITEFYNTGELKFEKVFKENATGYVINQYQKNGTLIVNLNFDNKKNEENAKTYYQTGELESELIYINGKLHGKSKQYYKNGNLKLITNFKNGKKVGISKKYYISGVLEYELEYKNDIQVGLEKMYYKNGILNAETEYKNGLTDGKRKVYYQNGKLEYIEHLISGKRNGYLTRFFKSGELESERIYNMDVIKYGIGYYRNSYVRWINIYKNGKSINLKKYTVEEKQLWRAPKFIN